MRHSTEIRPFRVPRPILRLINSDSQVIWFIVALWAFASTLAVVWLFSLG